MSMAIAIVRPQPPTTGIFRVEKLANTDLSIFRCALTNSYGVNRNHCASDTIGLPQFEIAQPGVLNIVRHVDLNIRLSTR